LRFRQWRDVDWANNFVGPDGTIYVRDRWMGEEKPEARIFRGYETAVGGFKRPRLDDLLERFDLPDRLEGLSPETQAKVEDIQSFDPPPSADQAAWRAWAKQQGVNPDTWSLGQRLREREQTDYWQHDSRDVPPVIRGGVFVGPDGYLYRHNDLTRPDYSTKAGAALEHQRAVAALRDAPPLSFAELYGRVLGSGALFPGSNLGRGYAGSSYGRRPVRGDGGQAWHAPEVQELLRKLRRWGRLGNPRTRALNARLARAGESEFWKHAFGAVDIKGKRKKEQYVPSPLGDFGLDGRKGSHYIDVTHEGRDGKMTYTQSMTRDPKTGKGTLDEQDVLLELFKRLGGNVIGVLKDPED
jgi:hypothetical protein